MSRIKEKLIDAKRRGGGFIPFVTGGDPDLATSLAIVLKLAEMGADVIELGVPFTDPMADGPTIQLSSQRAIDAGATLQGVLDLAADFRKQSDVPLVLFSYFNPILRFGLKRFADAATDAGIDGLLLTDVIENEAATISQLLGEWNIDLISLVAPTTSDERLEKICSVARGFIYAVSRAGVTGARDTTSSAAEELVMRTRRFTDLPVAVGFGISTAEQIADVWRYADAAVVGSAIVNVIGSAASPDLAVSDVGSFVCGLLPQFAKMGREN
ncbi:MAG: tryptophan synthase subunit alpha [Pyrinomonadaceae bacterium]|nr:tryptophan synthase subunit alpha [Pyrinomonadaceae bacterium]